MKTRHWNLIQGFTLAALLSLCMACSSEDDNLPQNEDKQPVQVNITRATTDGSGNWSWQNNDQVGLSINGTTKTLTYNNGSWAPAITGINLPATVEAWYPVSATMDRFEMLYAGDEYYDDVYQIQIVGINDQSSPDKLAKMDYMTTDATTLSDASLDVTLRHRMCHVTIRVVQNNGLTPSDVNMYSYSIVRRLNNEYDDATACEYVAIKPYITEGNTYQSIITPGLYYANDAWGGPLPLITMVVNGIKVGATYNQDLDSGNAYTFNLTINNPSTRSASTSECELELVEVQDMNENR